MSRFKVLAAVLAVSAFSTLAKADNIVVNPNFAGTTGIYGPIAGWTQSPYPSTLAGYPYLTGSDTKNGPFYDNGNSGTTTVGFIQTYPGSETDSLSQSLTLTRGQTYEFSFLENARALTGVDPTLTVTIGGVTLISPMVIAPVGDNNPFNLITGSFVANSSTELLSFSASSGGDATALITAVNVTAATTPEPSSLLLLGTGLVGAVGMARRRFLNA